MTEADWLVSEDPVAMLAWIASRRGHLRRDQRKPRQLAVEFWRWQAGNLKNPDDGVALLQAVALAEAWAETGVSPTIPQGFQDYYVLGNRAWTVARETMEASTHPGTPLARQARAYKVALIRELWGNPFHPVRIDPTWLAWNEGTVARLARSIYDEQTYGSLPILGDALEDAGCADPGVLSHCRTADHHVRGCWVLDLLLGYL